MKNFFNSQPQFSRLNSKYRARIFKVKDFEATKLGSLDVGDKFVFLADKSFRKILYRVTGKTYCAMYIIPVGDEVQSPTPAPFSLAVMKMPGHWKKNKTQKTRGVQSKFSKLHYKKKSYRKYDKGNDYDY